VPPLKAGSLDGVLLPLAGMVGPSEPPEPPALSAVAALNPFLGDPEVVAIAVATAALPFLVAGHHLVPGGSGALQPPAVPAPAVRAPAVSPVAVPPVAVPPVAVLLPPARHQPLLHADLLRQALLPLRFCHDLNPAVWKEQLQRERLLLPAPPSLLAHSPWREGGFAALPPADPLWEVLWLLVRQEQRQARWVEELVAAVRERVGVGEGIDGGHSLPAQSPLKNVSTRLLITPTRKPKKPLI
jgi:hypothetical protein